MVDTGDVLGKFIQAEMPITGTQQQLTDWLHQLAIFTSGRIETGGPQVYVLQDGSHRVLVIPKRCCR
jgi:hypothetical protein